MVRWMLEVDRVGGFRGRGHGEREDWWRRVGTEMEGFEAG